MTDRNTPLAASLDPLAKPLPAATAAAIGQIVARHAYLEWVLGQVMYSLMEISIKQGRVILKFPRPGQYVAAIRDLLDFHGLEPRVSLEELSRKLDAADRVRNVLTRSTYMSGGKAGVVLARSMWDPGPGGEIQPETQALSGEFLARCRKSIENAIESAEKFRATTGDLLRALHERRRTQRNLDRRSR